MSSNFYNDTVISDVNPCMTRLSKKVIAVLPPCDINVITVGKSMMGIPPNSFEIKTNYYTIVYQRHRIFKNSIGLL